MNQVFASWSGGKDSCLALYRAIREGGVPGFLLTTLEEGGGRSRGHGLSVDVVSAQASSLEVPLVVCPTSWDEYEDKFLSVIREFRELGVEVGIFGDIDLEEHREWVEQVCSRAGITPRLPLWKGERKELLLEFLEAGFEATVIAVREDALDKDLLGEKLSEDLIREIEKAGVDVSGEAGEYHTVVTSGPVFSAGLRLRTEGRTFRDGHWFLEVSVS